MNVQQTAKSIVKKYSDGISTNSHADGYAWFFNAAMIYAWFTRCIDRIENDQDLNAIGPSARDSRNYLNVTKGQFPRKVIQPAVELLEKANELVTSGKDAKVLIPTMISVAKEMKVNILNIKKKIREGEKKQIAKDKLTGNKRQRYSYFSRSR